MRNPGGWRKMRQEKQPKVDWFMGERMREFSRLAGAIRFTTMGYIKRAPGQTFKVFIDNPVTGLYRKFAGMYIISRVSHIFKKGTYDQELDLVRCDRVSDVANALLADEAR